MPSNTRYYSIILSNMEKQLIIEYLPSFITSAFMCYAVNKFLESRFNKEPILIINYKEFYVSRKFFMIISLGVLLVTIINKKIGIQEIDRINTQAFTLLILGLSELLSKWKVKN